MATEAVRSFIAVLEAAANGLPITNATVILSQIERESDHLVQTACHEFRHFLIDEDIRRRDEQYGALQRDKLRQYAIRLREKYD